MNQSARTTSDWVAARDADSPPELRQRVQSALAAVPEAESVVATLVDASAACLAAALLIGADRAAAAELLAADALLTYACEAAADEADPDALDSLLASVVTRLQPMLAEST